ncbi:MAG: caspase family protein [Planctomycetota bacterium]|nr:caspase family protein [Planctomycetota bacterium]
MKQIRWACLAASLVGLAGAPIARGQSESVGLTPRPGAIAPTEDKGSGEAEIKGVRRALLVGVAQGSANGVAQSPLPQCVIDARTLDAVLTPRGYRCEVLVDGGKTEPTAQAIRDEVAAMAGACVEDDQLLVYISTHGEAKDGASSVVAKDGLVDVEWIKRHMAASRAKVKILILDCCRGDKEFGRVTSEVRDVHVILACRPDQLSQTGGSGMSIFTEAMVDGLVECRADRLKDGVIELDELLQFVEAEVPKKALQLKPDQPQNPTRSVVDPKVMSPVFAQCTVLDRLTFGADAYVDAPPPKARKSLRLSNLALMTVQKGQTVAELEKALKGRLDEAPSFDAAGTGRGLKRDTPSEGELLVVEFASRKVAEARVLYQGLCEGEYNSDAVRGMIKKLIGDKPLVELLGVLKGLSPTEVQEKLGCAKSALLPTAGFPEALGELRYPGVPRPGQMFVVIFKDGTFETLDVVAEP